MFQVKGKTETNDTSDLLEVKLLLGWWTSISAFPIDQILEIDW